jgi:peptidoglycan/xylan/chitin deacetylase (PgdA/CDA1 family)
MSVNFLAKIACLSIDMELDLYCPDKRIRLLEEGTRLATFCSLLQRHNVPLTCFVVMQHATRYADALARLASATQTEFAVHSYSHDQDCPATVDEVRRSWDAYCDIWNLEPRGYRSPNCLIDTEGLRNLADRGFLYDSSVTPSVRIDKYGYNNWHLPTEPFWFTSRERRILELPVGCFGGVRLPLALSYMKLLGLRAMRAASTCLSLPEVAVIYFHPHDLYINEISHHIHGWKKFAHLRNARNGFRMLEGVIAMLKERGYQFTLMERAAEQMKGRSMLTLSSLSGRERSSFS